MQNQYLSWQETPMKRQNVLVFNWQIYKEQRYLAGLVFIMQNPSCIATNELLLQTLNMFLYREHFKPVTSKSGFMSCYTYTPLQFLVI